ncbi:MAG: oligosaccharide flippase family protein [Cytophagales bacterium]|nr:oligosaccharide flippase family protein [Cytophagales bacterium]
MIWRIINSDFFKKTSIVFVGNLINKIILLYTYYLLARNLEIKEYGLLMLCTSITTMVTNISAYGTNATLSRAISQFLQTENHQKIKLIFSTTVINVFFFSTLLCVILILFSENISYFILKCSYNELVIAASIGIPILVLQNMYISYFNGYQNFRVSMILNIIPSVFLLLAVSLLYYFNKNTLLCISLAFAICPLSFLLYFIFYNKDFFFPRYYNISILKDSFNFGKWMTLQSIIIIIQSKVDMFMLSYFNMIEQVSYYDIANKVQGIVLFLLGAYTTVLIPKMNTLRSKHEIIKFVNKNLIVSKILMAILIVVAIVSPFIINFLFSSKYAPSTLPLIIILLSLIPLVFIYPFNAALIAIGKSKIFFIVAIVQLIANVSISYILLPMYGAIGSGISYVLVNVISLIFAYYSYNYYFKIKYDEIAI